MKLSTFLVGTFATFALAAPVTMSSSHDSLAIRAEQTEGAEKSAAEEKAKQGEKTQGEQATEGQRSQGAENGGQRNNAENRNSNNNGQNRNGQNRNGENRNEQNRNGENRNEQNRNGENRDEQNRNENENEFQRGFDPRQFNNLVFNNQDLNYLLRLNALNVATIERLALENRFNVGGFQNLFTNNVFDVNSLLQLQHLNTLVSVADAGFFNGRDLSNFAFNGLQLGALGNLGGVGLNSFIDASQIGAISSLASQVTPVIVA